MAQYGVMRLKKVKGASVIAGHQAEANRTPQDRGRFEHSGIDWAKTDNNVILVKSENWGKDNRFSSLLLITPFFQSSLKSSFFFNSSEEEKAATFSKKQFLSNISYEFNS